jgi:putative ABC transport system ATP-binding protein
MQGARKVYGTGEAAVVALDSADLTVAAGEIVALVGPSGSGKTTLCSIAGALLTPTSGVVEVAGTDISAMAEPRRAKFRQRAIGFVFQTASLVPFLTARENLLVVDEMGPRRRAAAGRRADQLLAELGLRERARNLPGALSGGQRQRVAIGRALMNEPALVLFDEPTSALDTRTGESVMQLIQSELRRRGTAAIVVTHDARVTAYCDRSITITDGRLHTASA